MHIFFHGWFVGSIEFVYIQHILTHFFFFFWLSDSKAINNYNTALFVLKARKLDDIKLINIKKVLTSLGVPLPKVQHFTYENYAILLGKEFFAWGAVRRIDEWKVSTKSSLVLN